MTIREQAIKAFYSNDSALLDAILDKRFGEDRYSDGISLDECIETAEQFTGEEIEQLSALGIIDEN